MENNIHKALKEFWKELGLILEFTVITEYNIDGDHIDVVWKKDSELIIIEIESNLNRMQIWKNMTKALHLNPKLIIFDCLNNSIAKFIESKKEKIKIPIKIFNRGRNSRTSASMSETLIDLAVKKYSKKRAYYCPICKKRLLEGKSAILLAVHPTCHSNL